MRYYQTCSGYCYKEYSNGTKKRISQEQYMKGSGRNNLNNSNNLSWLENDIFSGRVHTMAPRNTGKATVSIKNAVKSRNKKNKNRNVINNINYQKNRKMTNEEIQNLVRKDIKTMPSRWELFNSSDSSINKSLSSSVSNNELDTGYFNSSGNKIGDKKQNRKVKTKK